MNLLKPYGRKVLARGFTFNHYIFINSIRENKGTKFGDFPNSEFVGERIISLPLSPALTKSDVNDVINAVQKLLLYFKK